MNPIIKSLILSVAFLFRLCKWLLSVLATAAFATCVYHPTDGNQLTDLYLINQELNLLLQEWIDVSLPAEALNIVIYLCIIVFVGIPVALSCLFEYAEQRLMQMTDEIELCKDFYSSQDDNLNGKFVLYLRAFDTTKKLTTQNHEITSPFRLGWAYHESQIELENYIKAACGHKWKLVALGRPGECIGAARLETTEGMWRPILIKLAHSARLIICVPSGHAGTLWEIKHLQQTHQLNKTLFVMPPSSPEFDVKSAWVFASNTLRKDGFELPLFDDKGLVFQLDAIGHVARKFNIDLQRYDSLRSVMMFVDRSL